MTPTPTPMPAKKAATKRAAKRPAKKSTRKHAHRPSRVGPHRMQEFTAYVVANANGNADRSTVRGTRRLAIVAALGMDDPEFTPDAADVRDGWRGLRRGGWDVVRLTCREDVAR